MTSVTSSLLKSPCRRGSITKNEASHPQFRARVTFEGARNCVRHRTGCAKTARAIAMPRNTDHPRRTESADRLLKSVHSVTSRGT